MLSFLFPRCCALCGKILEDPKNSLCETCSQEDIYLKEPLCYSCGKELESYEREYCEDCKKHPKIFQRGIGLCSYNKLVKQALAAIKYKNQRYRIPFFVEQTIRRRGRQLKAFQADCIVPVPLYKRKQRKRGFNQAELFARGISKYLQCPVEVDMIRRTASTSPQKNLDPRQRRKNLKHAFTGDRNVYAKAGRPKRVLIVDDIYTTGATVSGVSKALKELGVREIYIYCIAIGKGFS